MRFIIGVDIGGTFTDAVIVNDRGQLTLSKSFSTPSDFSQGIIDALWLAAAEQELDLGELLASTLLFLHGTTVAENAVVAGDIASVGLLTTRGFEDTLQIARGGYGRWSGLTEEQTRDPIHTDKPPPLIPRSMIAGVKERTDRKGKQVIRADPEEIEQTVQRLVDAGAESLAICFLWSFANPANEELAVETIKHKFSQLFLSVSHVIAPVMGEYERTSTVVLNSALGPVVERYAVSLAEKLRELGFKGRLLVAQAYGGVLPLELAVGRPVGAIESGPVSGLMGARWLGEKIGCRNVIAADMGGTTFKVGVIRDGLIEYQSKPIVYRYHFSLPKIDVTSLGLAGGSIISLDPRTGTPQIGPRSAGSFPGPICYDHGGEEPTITDVDAILGFLHPEYFLGGREKLNIVKAEQIFSRTIAEPLSMSALEAAAAIYKLVNSMIYDLLHRVTVERGIDPREYALFSFGGTAGMHVGSYSAELGVSQVVVPFSAAVHGAFGLVTSDVVHEEQLTRVISMPAEIGEVNRPFSELVDSVTLQLEKDGFRGSDILIERSVDMRFRRQVHVLNVPIGGTSTLDEVTMMETVDAFEDLYTKRYGKETAFRNAGIEILSFRVRGTGLVRKPALQADIIGTEDPGTALVERRKAYVSGSDTVERINGYDFEKLSPGNEIRGPAIIWTSTTTVVLGDDQAARVDEYKDLVITLRGALGSGRAVS